MNNCDCNIDTIDMLIIFTRAIIVYVFLLLVMRLMGKKQLGELQPFEFAITLISAEIACIPMSDSTVPMVYGLVPIFTLFVLHLALTKTLKHSIKLRRVINGKPIIVIDGDGINYKAISKLDMTINDLMESLRGAGYFSPAEVQYAIIETNGDLSVLPKSDNTPVTLGDMNISIEQKTVPFMLVCEGKILSQNLQTSGLSNDLIQAVMIKYKLKQRQILLLLAQNGKELYIQPIGAAAIKTTVNEVQDV